MRVSPALLAQLSAATCDGNRLTLSGQLDRKTYVALDKVLQAAGGKWDRRSASHVFDRAAAEAIDPILLTGEVTNAKQEFGFFESPPAVVERLMQIADVQPGHDALEPSAGRGAIALPLADATGKGCMCVELLGANVEALKATRRFGSIIAGDFLTTEGLQKFDRIVMNPPFARQADIAHVRHAAGFLAPGGRLVSVMSQGVRFRQDRKAAEFRAWVAERGGTFEDLPAGSFKPSGTNVSACIVSFERAA